MEAHADLALQASRLPAPDRGHVRPTAYRLPVGSDTPGEPQVSAGAGVGPTEAECMPPTSHPPDDREPTDEPSDEIVHTLSNPMHATDATAALTESIDEPLTATVEVDPETYALAKQVAEESDEPIDMVLYNYAGITIDVESADTEGGDK